MKTRSFNIPGALLLIAALAGPALAEDPPPLGEESTLMRGDTAHLNDFCAGWPGCQAPVLASSSAKTVLGILVDTNDHPYTGSPGDLTTYRDNKLADYEGNSDAYWLESSYGMVGIDMEIPDEIFTLAGAFDDYYNRDYVDTTLTTNGVSFPLNGSAEASIHVHDAHDRNKFVDFSPNANNLGELVDACNAAFDAVTGVPAEWVECSAAGGELRIALVQDETAEATFIRVDGGSDLADLGLDGPIETQGTPTRLEGKQIPGGFPVGLNGGAGWVDIEVRAHGTYPVTRRYSIGFPDATYGSPEELVEGMFLPVLNAEFDWVQFEDYGDDRVGMRLQDGFVGENAALRIVGGANLDQLGLDGPQRVDGVISFDKRRTVRGKRSDIVAEALSLYIAERAAVEGISITAANESDLNTLVDQELDGYDSFLVLLVDQGTSPGIPTSRRAGASASAWFDLAIPGEDGYVYERQKNAGFMIGPGYAAWTTWAHELGHTLGFPDLYFKSDHQNLDSTFDYVNDWGLMDSHSFSPHAVGWSKLKKQTWFPAGSVADIYPPPLGSTHHHEFTLVPSEHPFGDYAGIGSPGYPERQLLRIWISDHHWVLVENRQPGDQFSQNLPDDWIGDVPPDGSAQPGGLLITDACDINTEFSCPYRPRVVNLNPYGTQANARGIAENEVRSLNAGDSNPAYDGIIVTDLGPVAGPPGQPDARQVQVTWGPGDFVELEIRPWQAPEIYGTPDIWVDWPGNGEENYPGNPPIDQGEEVHWHPDGTVLNLIKVRVHNEGTIEAKNVVVRASVNEPGGMGDSGEFVPIGDSAPQNIPPGDYRDFAFNWYPDDGEHTCILAEILSHESDLGDLDPTNNLAQENVFLFTPESNSPYKPVEFDFKVNNDYDFPVDVWLTASGLVDGVDLEMEKTQLHLEPDEHVVLTGRFLVDINKIPAHPSAQIPRLRINTHALLETADGYEPFGGMTFDLDPGYGCDLYLDNTDCDPDGQGTGIILYGRLDGPYAAFETVDIAVVGSDGRSYGGTGETDAAGNFIIKVEDVPLGAATAMLYYFGPDMAKTHLGPVPIQVTSCGAPKPIPPTMTVDRSRRDPDRVTIHYDVAGGCNASDHAVLFGKIGTFDQVTDTACSVGNSGSVSLQAPPGDVWFLMTGMEGDSYSSMGTTSDGLQRKFRDLDLQCPALVKHDVSAICP
ncbi:hypothetical protein ABI59_22280 [Acidobacteria bacterium Mor1]|nr:hypothetical protein ABI59_22280 [Acidobacteria bacterium Mor1]